MEELNKEVSGHSGEHDIILCLATDRIGFNLLDGMKLCIKYDIVCAEVGGLVFAPYLKVGRRLGEGGCGKLGRRRHGWRMWLLWGEDMRKGIRPRSLSGRLF